MKTLLPFLLLLCSCKKVLIPADRVPEETNPTSTYVQYNIPAGGHYCDKNDFKQISLSDMNFKVRFDSSAVYYTSDPLNQYDINKLYGFSEGNDHHVNSARIGWSWNEGALKLYAYTYNNGLRDSKEICAVLIGNDITCRISVSGDRYSFKVNDVTVTMQRSATSPLATGYKLYPYFGGDETAPIDIRIFIEDL